MPERRGLMRMVADGLANLMTGSGTSVDRRMQSRWLQNILVQQEVEDAYRGSWLVRKIVDLPPYDMTRAWRDWQADDTQIEDLEAEERRLHVRERILQGLILGRLGGGLVIMGGLNGDMSSELNPETVGQGDLQYLFAISRWKVKVGDPVTDTESAQFGEPEVFNIQLNGREIDVHHSRCLVFRGAFTGKLGGTNLGASDFWGDSVVTVVDEAVRNAQTVHNEFASLVSEAKIDVYKIPELMANAGNPEYEQRFLRRMELANIGKSNHRALIMDKDEEWEQRQLNLAGMAELATTYMAIVAGAADIPATRLLGKSPDGMNATGESDQDNYEQMIRTKQDNELRPILDKLDEVLIRSALGKKPDEVYYDFAPLTVLSDAQAAEVESKEATTLKTLVDTGLFQDDALEEAFSNRMIESNRWPGYEKARDKAIKEAEANPTEEEVTGVTNPPNPAGPQPGPAPVPPPPPPAPRAPAG